MLKSRPGVQATELTLKDSPFVPGNSAQYEQWKALKLDQYPKDIDDLIVPVADPYMLSENELNSATSCIRKTNSVFYRLSNPKYFSDKDAIRMLGKQFGLDRLDGNLCADDDSISSLTVMPQGSPHEGYIPYTNKAINWHTDGYYNTPETQIQAMLLHCASDAEMGGENDILDPEIMYIMMRDENPDFISAFMQADVMTIPPNVENGVEIRGSQTGPVFSIDAKNGNLHMRYTARKRNIIWKDDAITRDAVSFIEHLFSRGSGYIYRYRLSPGEGIISNNALHNRAAFSDSADKKRLIYRARYYDRVRNTNFNEIYDTGVLTHDVAK